MVKDAKELEAYKKAYRVAMRVFELSKGFPPEERFALTGQLRRASRSVCQNLREAWAKRRYEAHFINKLTDCLGENWETDTCLDFAMDCAYISSQEHLELMDLNNQVGRMLFAMMNNPHKFTIGK